MRKTIHAITASIVALALLNIISFVIPFVKSPSFWVGYSFLMVAAILQIGTAFTSNSSKKTLQSRFYHWPILYISTIYLIIQFLVSMVLMAFSTISISVAVCICSIILAFALLGMIATSAASDAVEKIDRDVKEKVDYIKSLAADVSILCNQCQDPDLHLKLTRLFEAIRYSDPMSDKSLSSLENEIRSLVERMSILVQADELNEVSLACEQAQKLLLQRNQKCKLLK